MPPSPPVPHERFLRYWSANMAVAFVQSGGAPWIGFGYSPAEMARMRGLAATLPGAAVAIFFALTVVTFIALAALGIAGFMVPVLDWLYPNPADTQALVMVLILACVCFFSLGFGLPLAVRAGAWAGDRFGGGKPAPGQLEDAALIAKIRFQLWRMVTIMVGVFIPGCMLFILFDIKAGPVVSVLKAVLALVTAFSILQVVRERKG